MRQFYILLFLIFTWSTVEAQNAGFFGTPLSTVQYNDGNVQEKEADTFDGSSLGVVTTLELNGAEVYTFKNGGADVTGAFINYRVYEASSTPPSFTEQSLNFGSDLSNPGDQRWETNSLSIDLLSGLSPGDYKFEVYFRISINNCCGGQAFQNNSGNNYKADFIIPYSTTQAGTWDSTTTWDSGEVPPTNAPVEINHAVTISSDVDHSGNITINSPNVLSISPGHSLKFTGSTFTNNGGVLMTSSSSTFSSFIPSTSSTLDGTGGYEYERHTNSNTNGNDLISPPLSNDTFGAFATRNNANLFSDSGNANIKLFGPFTTSATAPEYIEYVVGTDDDSESLISGKGYRGASVSGNNLAYQGSVLKDDVSASIINNGETDFKSWNLVGNPFSSYVQLGIDLLNSTTINSLDTNYQSFYFYNAGTSGSYPGATTQGNWTIVNVSYVLSNEDTAIAPGQGFFVKAKSGSGSVLFEESSRFTATDAASSDDGIAGRNTTTTSNIARAKIGLSTANNTSEIDIYFLDDATLGLDPGYDVGGFGGSSFGIFTNLLNGDTGVQMAIQSLPYSSLNSVSIPLGINMDAGTQFTLELNDVYSLLPDGIDLYLDDTLENTSTLLNSGDYVLTPVTSLSGTGRFYLRFSNNALTTTEQRLDHVTVYTNQSTKTINISGQLDAGTIAMVYDIQGREIITQKLSSESILQRIDSDDLHTGVYIVKLYTKTKSKSVKLVIR